MSESINDSVCEWLDKQSSSSQNNGRIGRGESVLYDIQRKITIFPWKILLSKVVFFKNYYLFPITINLLQVGNDFFVVRLSKYNVMQFKINFRFLVIENLAGLANRESGKTDLSVLQEIKVAFRSHHWEDFLVHLVVVSDDSVTFNSNIGFISYIEF